MTLLTRCTSCAESLFLDANLRAGQPFHCPHCGQRAYVWQLLGRANRETVVEDYAPQFPPRVAVDREAA